MIFDETTLESLKLVFTVFEKNYSKVLSDFYSNLFKADPSLKRLFPDDLNEHFTKVTNEFLILGSHLTDLTVLKNHLQDLGRNHRDYGGIVTGKQ